MRIMVFGAGGNVGRRVVAEAHGRGHEVTAVLRTPARTAALPAGVAIRTGKRGECGRCRRTERRARFGNQRYPSGARQ